MSGPSRFPWRKLLAAFVGVVVLFSLVCASLIVCLPAWLRWGIVADTCPSGRPVAGASIHAVDLRREVYREVNVSSLAWYTPDLADQTWSSPLRAGDVELVLVMPDGSTQVLEPRKSWKRRGSAHKAAEIMLPATLTDGDYTLRATVQTRLGPAVVESPLPLYAPARVHLLTDRPLYEPGNTIQMRAVMVRASDRLPLAERRGTWEVVDPQGELLLEESAVADDWGVVAGSFPIDAFATSGDWTVRWRSGPAVGESVVRVEPFTLPRFRVEATPSQPFYAAGDQPLLRGKVTYSSGAPVAGATLDLRWRSTGDWPPPSEWLATDGTGLPIRTTTDARGAWSLTLPAVPADLVGQASLIASIDATDPAGDRVPGSATLMFSQDRIQVQAVTDLGEGLVEGFNNRLYLRASTAAGQPLRSVDLRVRRAWDPSDPGKLVKTDEDGVAAMQVDPGPAVNIIVPPLPVRPPPPTPAIGRAQVEDLVEGETVDLADQRAIDEWTPALTPCARFQGSGSGSSELVARISPQGVVEPVAPTDPLASCLSQVVSGLRLPAGPDRLYRLAWPVSSPDLPTLQLSPRAWPQDPADIDAQLRRQALDARACLPADSIAEAMPRRLQWRLRAGSATVETRWLDRDRSGLGAEAVACVERTLSRLTLARPSSQDAIGLVDIELQPAPRARLARPQATTMLGYELRIDALDGDEDLGQTTLRLAPGVVPSVRLRLSSILPKAGEELTVEVLRGPDFSGELPDKLFLRHQSGWQVAGDLDPKTRLARFTLPADKDGWYSVEWYGALARAFVRPQGELAVSVQPDRPTYAPGDTATLDVTTRQGEQGAPASVGLFGVDESLGQITTLPGPDALTALRDPVTTGVPAFGSLDGQALALGRIQGENAAAATVLRVTGIPVPEDTDSGVSISQTAPFDPVEGLTDRFYTVLGELHAQVRAWEKSAPAGTQLDNPTMAELWSKARAACQDRGENVEDVWGRPLRLHWLPEDLLALTDPRVVVVDGTRLPEDIEAWSRWVSEEKPR